MPERMRRRRSDHGDEAARGGSGRAFDLLAKRPQASALRRGAEGAIAASSAGRAKSGGVEHMALILDHINGVPDDNRLENLQIVCPNCAATLDTHCGRKNRSEPPPRNCKRCGGHSCRNIGSQRYCSRACGAAGIASICVARRARSCARSSGRRRSSCWPRSRPRAIWRSGGSTGSRTTRCASGCGSTSARAARVRRREPLGFRRMEFGGASLDPEVREALGRSWKAVMAIGVIAILSAASRSWCRRWPRSGRRSSSAGCW